MARQGTVGAGDFIVHALETARTTERSTAVRAEVLRAVPLFAALSRHHRHKVAALMTEVSYPHGRVVVRAGDAGNTFFVVLDGAARVYKGGMVTGRASAVLRPGDFFGEMSVLDGAPRSATVVATGNLSVLRLTRSAFIKMISKEPSVAVAIMAGLAARLRRGEASE